MKSISGIKKHFKTSRIKNKIVCLQNIKFDNTIYENYNNRHSNN